MTTKQKENQQWAIYYDKLDKWKKMKPKNGNNYDIEAWLEMKPEKPGELPSRSANDANRKNHKSNSTLG